MIEAAYPEAGLKISEQVMDTKTLGALPASIASPLYQQAQMMWWSCGGGGGEGNNGGGKVAKMWVLAWALSHVVCI